MSLQSVLQGDLTGWRGLPDDLTRATLAEALAPVTRVGPSEERVRTYQRWTATPVERAVPPEQVEAWAVFGQAAVSLLEWDDPPVTDLPATLESLGSPDLLLQDRRFVAGGRVAEYVYARRGLALAVATPFPGAATTAPWAVHLQVFPATTTQFYLTDIGPGPDPRPQTLPGGGEGR